MRRALFGTILVVTLASLLLVPVASAAPRSRAAEPAWSSLWSWVAAWFGKARLGAGFPTSLGDHTDDGPAGDPWG